MTFKIELEKRAIVPCPRPGIIVETRDHDLHDALDTSQKGVSLRSWRGTLNCVRTQKILLKSTDHLDQTKPIASRVHKRTLYSCKSFVGILRNH